MELQLLQLLEVVDQVAVVREHMVDQLVLVDQELLVKAIQVATVVLVALA